MFRRRRAGVLLAILLLVVAIIVIPRIATAAAAAAVRSDLASLADAAHAVLAESDTIAPEEASAALAQSRDRALATEMTDEEASDAASALGASVTAFRAAAVDSAMSVLGNWSDAEKSTEDALHAEIEMLRDASPADLADAVAGTAVAASAVIASAQEYRDGLVASAALSSTQPTEGDVAAQVEYLLTYADDYNTGEWGDYNSAGGDCVNFTSQGLLARGWQMDDDWHSSGPWGASRAWRSTPSIDDYLSRLGFAVSTIDDLDRVRLGDVGVFDWGDTGPGLDHTMTVSRVEYSPDGPIISFASHNSDGQYRPMPKALADPESGSTMRIYSIP